MKQNKCRKIVISILLIIGILLISFNDAYAACAKCSYSGIYMGQPCPNCDGKPAGGNDSYTCSKCSGTGELGAYNGKRPCDACNGTGVIKTGGNDSDSDSYCQKCGGDGITSTGEKCTYCNPDITPGENNSNKNKCSKCGGDGIIGEYDPTERKCDACNGTGEKKTGGGETDTGGNDSDTPGGDTDTGGNDSDTPGSDTDTGGNGSTPGGGTNKKEDVDKHTAGDIIDGAGSFIEIGEKEEKIKQDNLKTVSDTLYNILLVVGIIAALIVGLILGIKFILGSLEEKAEIKTMVVPYIIGCVVVFGAFTIWQIIVDLLQSV